MKGMGDFGHKGSTSRKKAPKFYFYILCLLQHSKTVEFLLVCCITYTSFYRRICKKTPSVVHILSLKFDRPKIFAILHFSCTTT